MTRRALASARPTSGARERVGPLRLRRPRGRPYTPHTPMPRTAACLVIGNEILSGKIQDANTVTLARELRALGVELRRVVVVPDEIDLIAHEVNALRNAHDWLFTSGGVGPTHDDVTIAAVARALGRAVVRYPSVEKLLRDFYGARCTEDHLRMADLVEGTELVVSPESGVWPTFVLGNVFVLPGVPEIFKMKLATVRERLRGGEAFVLRSVYTRGDEGEIKRWIDAVVERYPDVAVGSYPRFRDADHNVRVTFDGRDVARVDAASREFASLLPPALLVRTE
jgi:molybdenum cofactor synthesis domain-containing protein